MPHAPCLIPHATRLNTSRRQISGPNEMELFCCRAFSWLDFHFVVNKFIKRIPLPCFHLGLFRFRAADRIGHRALGSGQRAHFQVRNYNAKNRKGPKEWAALGPEEGGGENSGKKNPENQQRCRGQTGQVTRLFRPPRQQGNTATGCKAAGSAVEYYAGLIPFFVLPKNGLAKQTTRAKKK